MQNERCVFLPFTSGAKVLLCCLWLQEFALSNGDKLPDMRRWWASAEVLLAAAAQQRGGRVKYLFAFTSFRSCASHRQECLQSTRLFVYMCACSIQQSLRHLRGVRAACVQSCATASRDLCSAQVAVVVFLLRQPSSQNNEEREPDPLSAMRRHSVLLFDFVPRILLRCYCVRQTIYASMWKHSSSKPRI